MSAIAELGLDASGFVSSVFNAKNALSEFKGVADKVSESEVLPEGKTKKTA